MDSINENKTAESFPFEFLRRFRNVLSPDLNEISDFSARSYDNRGRISDVAASLRSKLGYFQTRLSSNSFLSSDFSWQVKTATSSTPSTLLAKAMSDAGENDYSFEIDSIAKIRTAVSKRLVSDEVTLFDTGTYTYTLAIDDQVYSIDVIIDNPIGDPATNRSVLLDIERSINRLGVGVNASLEDTQVKDYNPYRENAYKDVSYLYITNDASGDDIDFSLIDVTGSLMAELNLDKVSQFGAQNQYRVNGDAQSDDSNQVTLESGKIGAYLLGTTGADKNAKVSIKQDRSALSNELTKIIEDYNQLIHWIDDNDYAISPSLKNQLFKNLSSLATKNKSMTRSLLDPEKNNQISERSAGFNTRLHIDNKNTIDADLESIGLTLNMDGSIEIGEDFSQSVSGKLRKVYDALAGDNGFFSTISDNIDTIHGKNESNYVFAFNSILSYNPEGINRQSVYKQTTASIISFFA